MKEIVCISTSNYYPFPTRKQNVMNRLRDAEIIYINPPFTLLGPLKDKSLLKRVFEYKKPGIRVKDNIIVFSPPPVLPFFNRYRFINRINQKILGGFIKKKIEEAGFKKPYLWCYSPTSADIIGQIPNRGLIYDCVDMHSAYPGQINPSVVDAMEADLVKQALQVFCTAESLCKRLRQYNKNTMLMPNGVNYELFSLAQEDFFPDDLAEAEKEDSRSDGKFVFGEKPIFGFVGMLQDCIEYDYMAALAEAFPEGEILLIGKSLPGVDFSVLDKYENIKILGLMPQDRLPEIMKTFHVCLNLFKDNELSAHVSPLKFYEYLATGKPIVSTAVPAQVRNFEDVVLIAENKEDFVIKCKEALEDKDPAKRNKRIAYAKEASWDNIVKKMEEIIGETEETLSRKDY